MAAALARKKQADAEKAQEEQEEEEERRRRQKSAPAKTAAAPAAAQPDPASEWAALEAAVAQMDNYEGEEDDEDDLLGDVDAPPSSLPPAPAWDSDEELSDDPLEERLRMRSSRREREEREEHEKKEREERERKEHEERQAREERERAANAKAAKAAAAAASSGPLAVGSTVKAKYPYQAKRDDELSFKKHDVITIVALDPKGKWHTGSLGGSKGKFPANYI